MDTAAHPGLAVRASLYRALGDPARLLLVDLVALGDRTPGELRERSGLDWNLLNFHIRALETAGVVERHVSEGDRRRRYVRLRPGVFSRLPDTPRLDVSLPLFVCTGNAARSQFAAALWTRATGRGALSAGTAPATAVHPLTVEVASRHGLDLSGVRPQPLSAVTQPADLVVSVCDRSFEAGVELNVDALHWSVPDPQPRRRSTFERAFRDISERIDRLATAAA